jgi:two-component system, chemotaxis family, chemotaxis protein CheY
MTVMRVRITGRPHGVADGVSLDRFDTGLIYDVGTTIGNLLLAEKWAEPVEERFPALVVPLPDERLQPNVLVIDDDDQFRTLLSMLLSLHGYAVCTATNGAEGLQRLQRPPIPTLILLDVNMPRMDGAAFRDAQRGLPAPLSEVPVVVISGLDLTGEQRERMRAADYISKPIDDTSVLDVVRSYCGVA